MTHKPPVPDAAVSPYPLTPEPTPDKPVETATDDAGTHLVRNIGIAAGAAIGSAAVAAALIFYNRPAPKKRAPSRPAAKRTPKAATTKTAKPRSAAAKPADKAPAKAAPKTAAKPRARKAKPAVAAD